MSPSPEPMRRTVTFTDQTETCPRTPYSSPNAELDNARNMESEERKAVASILASWPQQPISRPIHIPLDTPASPSVASTEGYSHQGLTPERLSNVSKWLKDASEALHDPVWRTRASDNLPTYSPTTPSSCMALTAAPTYMNGSQGYVGKDSDFYNTGQMPYPTYTNFQQGAPMGYWQPYPTCPPPAYEAPGYVSGPPQQPYASCVPTITSTQVIDSHFRPIPSTLPPPLPLSGYSGDICGREALDERFTCPNCKHQYWVLDNRTIIPVVPTVNRQATTTCTGRNNIYVPQPIRPLTDSMIPPPTVFSMIPTIYLPDTSNPPPGYPPVNPAPNNVATVVPQPQSVPAPVNPNSRKRAGGVYDTTIRKLSFTPTRQH